MAANPKEVLRGISEEEFKHRHAAHCESGTVTTLLHNRGLELSEAMVFGIGGGMFFIHLPWVTMGGLPLTAYRDAPRSIIKNICKRLGVRMVTRRFRNPDDGERALDELLDQGMPVGIQANIFWLPYFPEDMRFQYNGHNMVVYGKRGDEYLISDPVSDKMVTCPAEALKRARFTKGIFAPRGLLYYPEYVPTNPDIVGVLPMAIRHTVKRMLDIPIPMFGVKGIRFLAKYIEKWPDKYGLKKASAQVGNVVRMQEEIGTGGAGFRFVYAAFLQEAGEMLGNDRLREISQQLSDAGDRWRDFAVLGAQLTRGKIDGPDVYLELANIVRECADREEQVYSQLRDAI